MFALLLSCLSGVASAQNIAIGGYALPTAGTIYPSGITAGPDGAVWFTEQSANRIGRITAAGAVTGYEVPTTTGWPYGITTGPDGALWFTEQSGNKIGRITTSGVISEYPIPTLRSEPSGITAGPDGALWFTEQSGNKIGSITTDGVIAEYTLPTSDNQPAEITTGPDGALWFTASRSNMIDRMTTTGVLTDTYKVPTASAAPQGITTGPDGALWFTEYGEGKIGRITIAGVITEYKIPDQDSLSLDPFGITTGPDGALWFTEYGAASGIGRITTSGVITVYPVPTAYTWSGGEGITTGPDGALWFAELLSEKIGEAVFVTADLSVSPSTGFYNTNLVFAASAFAPAETVQIYTSGVGSAVLAAATADATGSFTVSARAPLSAYGPRLFLGVGQSSGSVGAASFSFTPRLILSPTSGQVGSSATIEGTSFGSLEQVKIYWANPLTLLGTVTANVTGTFNRGAALIFTVPAGAAAGVNRLCGVGQTTKANGCGSFTVE